MGYADNNLQNDEEVIVRARFSYLSAAGSVMGVMIIWILAILLFAMGKALGGYMHTLCTIAGVLEILAGLGIFGFCILSIKCRELVVTNKRVIGKQGIMCLLEFR